jgi:hypothetical protein
MHLQTTGRLLAVVRVLTCGTASFAEECGSGHYLPGSMASFIDGVPPTETFLTRVNVVKYDGSASVTWCRFR